MKRYLWLLLAAFMLMSLVGCSVDFKNNASGNGGKPTDAPTIAPTEPVIMESEPVIVEPTEPVVVDPTEPVVVEPTEPGVADPTEPTEATESTEPLASDSADSGACSHDYAEATCDAPAQCTICGETNGEALGHNFEGGDCETAGKCSRCGKTADEPDGHKDGYGGKCAVCGSKTERYYDIQKALNDVERYFKYSNSNYELIDNQYEQFKLTKDPRNFTKAHEYVLEIHEYLQKIIGKCEDYKELDMLTDDCRDLILEMPIVPESSSDSAMRSYISDARSYARDASRLSVIYNVLCENYELPGV